MKKTLLFFALTGLFAFGAKGQAQQPYSVRMAETVMKIWPDSFSSTPGKSPRWSYDHGVVLKGIEGIWNNSGNAKWFNYIQKMMDYYVKDDGSIYDYRGDEYNIDYVNNGKLLLLLYRVTGKDKYRKAANLLREQLKTHPRNSEGGFWHKKVYPNQMWLDGLYMAEPFYAEYAQLFHEDTAFNDIARQFILVEKHTRDPKTGLLYHGWDESREQKWADPKTGTSPHFWARALGWYGMALVDALDYFPESHPQRKELIAILNRFATAVAKVQDAQSGLWFDIVDMPRATKNYHEASASCMLVYTLAKAVRNGYIPASFAANAKKGYAGILKEFVKTENGQLNLYGTVSVSGLGGKPYRDGSYDYYMSEKVVMNDPKGIGAFILCAVEMEMQPGLALGKGKTVLLDRYFNAEKKKDATGTSIYWHYTWEERSNGGFSTFGNVFKKYGARLASLDVKPDAASLKNASVYIIVDPDHVKDNPQPNYMDATAASAIYKWVQGGGILLLMANDSANCDLEHFNLLANKMGITFTNTSRNMVKNDEWPTGTVYVTGKNPVFQPREMYLKEISVLKTQKPATAIVTKENDVIIAIAKVGKGAVLAVGDPWLYNEYLDGRKLPSNFDNYGAAEDIAKWLLKNAVKK